MKATLLLQVAAAAYVTASAINLNPEQSTIVADNGDHTIFGAWVDSIKAHALAPDDISTSLEGPIEWIATVLDDASQIAESIEDEVKSQLIRATGAKGQGNEFSEHTIYDLIKFSEHSTKFAEAIDEYPDLVKLLNSTDTNHTVFVPVDEAFEHIPDHGKKHKPSKEFIENALKYHIGIGDYPVVDILHTHTLPTELEEPLLGDEPQRLRIRVGLLGVRVNFYSKVVAADIKAKNGVIHAVRSILVPPTYLGGIVNLFPSRFSTLILAWKKVDFVKFIHGVNSVGSTMFTPSNAAFDRLGARTILFLFNTDKGLKYLNAILKYHIAANVTLYSDEIYDKRDDNSDAEAMGSEHFDLNSLLHGAHIAVDIRTLLGFREYRINGFTLATVQDVPGKNGVIQVTDKVLLPPCKHKSAEAADYHYDGGEISVEELMERLDGYVEPEEDWAAEL